MTFLVACLTTGKGTWRAVSEIVRSEDWNKVFLVTNEFGKAKYTPDKEAEFIMINPDESIEKIRDSVVAQLKGKIMDAEVALNMESGSGKEHMAILSAVLRLGLGVRLVYSDNSAMKEL